MIRPKFFGLMSEVGTSRIGEVLLIYRSEESVGARV